MDSETLKHRIALPLDAKIKLTNQRIYYGG